MHTGVAPDARARYFGRSVSGARIGVAPGTSKAIIGKVLGQGGRSSAEIASAIPWAADEDARIISISVEFDFPKHVDDPVQTGRAGNSTRDIRDT